MAVVRNWNTVPGIIPREGLIRKAFSGKNSMMTLNEVKPGTPPWLHSNPEEQLAYIVSGRAEFVLGDEVLTLKAGDLLVVPPHVPHSMTVIGEEPVMSIDVLSPIRKDFL
jgi:quercetin dioxygenase-like cupin family protein